MASNAAEAQILDEERRLIDEAKRGNLDALRPILDKYSSPLYATVILPRMGDAAAAEDVLRDTIMTAVTKLDSFTWQGRSFYGWLRQIAVNKAYDVHRKTKRQRKLADAFAAEAPRETDRDASADQLLIAEQERERNKARIEATLDRLSGRYRTAIELRLIRELPREDCAATLNIAIGTFDVLLYRAVRSFRKHFGGRDDG